MLLYKVVEKWKLLMRFRTLKTQNVWRQDRKRAPTRLALLKERKKENKREMAEFPYSNATEG